MGMWEWKERALDITWGSFSEKSSTLKEQPVPLHPLRRSTSQCCIILSNSSTFNKPPSIVFNFMKRKVNKNADIIDHWPFQPTTSTKPGENLWQQDGGWILLSEAQEQENLCLSPRPWTLGPGRGTVRIRPLTPDVSIQKQEVEPNVLKIQEESNIQAHPLQGLSVQL